MKISTDLSIAKEVMPAKREINKKCTKKDPERTCSQMMWITTVDLRRNVNKTNFSKNGQVKKNLPFKAVFLMYTLTFLNI